MKVACLIGSPLGLPDYDSPFEVFRAPSDPTPLNCGTVNSKTPDDVNVREFRIFHAAQNRPG